MRSLQRAGCVRSAVVPQMERQATGGLPRRCPALKGAELSGEAVVEFFQHLLRRYRNHRSGTEYRGGTIGLQELVVLRGNYAPGDHHDVIATQLAQLFHQLRHERLVACSKRADADHVDIVFDGLASHLLRGLKQRPDVDVKAEISECGGNDLGPRS